MGLGGAVRAHLVEVYGAAGGGGLERGLGAGESAADYFDLLHTFQTTGFWADFRPAGRESGLAGGQDLLDGVRQGLVGVLEQQADLPHLALGEAVAEGGHGVWGMPSATFA